MSPEELKNKLEEISRLQTPEERIEMLESVKQALTEVNDTLFAAYTEAKKDLPVE